MTIAWLLASGRPFADVDVLAAIQPDAAAGPALARLVSTGAGRR